MKRALAIILLVQIALGILYAFATPIFEASDEIWHYPVVLEISDNRRLPVQDRAVDAPWAQEGSQPPLYYALAAQLTGWLDTSDYPLHAMRNPFAKTGIPLATDNKNMVVHPPDQGPRQGGAPLAVMLIRLFSILLGTATVYLASRLSDLLYPARPAVGLLAAALIAFNPMVLFINASVNNDNLLMLLATSALLLMVRDMQSRELGLRLKKTLLLGIVLGLASLTKVSGLVLLPIAALAVSFSAWQARSWRAWLARGSLLVLVVAAIAGWWYLRNLSLYGELTGIERMVEVAGARPDGFGLGDLRREWTGFWYSFWGVFGAFNVLAPRWFYVWSGGLSLVAGLGLAAGLVRLARKRRLPRQWQSHALLLSFILLTFIGLTRWTLMTTASQGRLMFGAIGPISFYLALGILNCFPAAWHRPASQGLAGMLAVIALLLPFIAIRPAYTPPAPIQALPADAIGLDIRCDDGVILAGYQFDSQAIQPGEPLDVTLYWTSDRALGANLDLSLNGYGYELENIAKLDTWPGGGLWPTSYWRPGEIYPDRYIVETFPDSHAPTLIKLAVSFATHLLDPAQSRSVPCMIDGETALAIVLDAGELVGPLPAGESSPPAGLANLDQGIQLQAFEWTPGSDQMRLVLTWAASQQPPADYTVFVHLLSAQGEIISQDDASPRQGYWPTSRWRLGEVVTSTHTLALPLDFFAGGYEIGVGLYDPATGERLPAYRPEGGEWQDWIIRLPIESGALDQ